MPKINIIRDAKDIAKINLTDNTVFGMDVEKFLDKSRRYVYFKGDCKWILSEQK